MFDVIKKAFGLSKPKENSQNEKVYKIKKADDLGISIIRNNGEPDFCKWDEINKISFVTTDQGPIADDLFLKIYASDKDFLITCNLKAMSIVEKNFSRFENFNYELMTKAMSSASNNEFVCWDISNKSLA